MAKKKKSGVHFFSLVALALISVAILASIDLPLNEGELSESVDSGKISKCKIIRASGQYGNRSIHFEISLSDSTNSHYKISAEDDLTKFRRYYKALCDSNSNVKIHFKTTRPLLKPWSRNHRIQSFEKT